MISLLVAQSIQYRFVAIVELVLGGPAHISAVYAFRRPAQIQNKHMIKSIVDMN